MTIRLRFYLPARRPKAEVTVAGPPRWEKRLTADDQGRVAVPTPWTGRYVLEVHHFDEKPRAGGN